MPWQILAVRLCFCQLNNKFLIATAKTVRTFLIAETIAIIAFSFFLLLSSFRFSSAVNKTISAFEYNSRLNSRSHSSIFDLDLKFT